MSQRVRFTRVVGALPATVPFVGPEAIERGRGRPFDLRLGANESAFGVSPRAAEAMREAIGRLSWYGDPEGYELRSEIAARHGVDIGNVCLAGGIDELLGLAVRALIEPGMPVASSLGAYPTFHYQVAAFGGVLHAVPYRDDRIDLEALAGRVRASGARLAYLANPDNPMGTWHDAAAVAGFLALLPEDCVLVLDEAYGHFAPAGTRLPEDPGDPRVVRMHTFSKAFGMAGARIGYAIAHQALISAFDRIRNHFAVNRVAQAGALASLRDPDFVRRVVAEVAAGREDYAALARDLGLRALPSATNFVAIDAGGGGDRARRLLRLLEERGVFVRMPGVAPLDRCIRVTVGSAAERALFAERFRDACAALDRTA